MLKISTDGSGVTNMISGCPNCEDGSKALLYYNSQWWFDKSRDMGRYGERISYCPFCGIKLPALDRWVVREK